MFKIFCFVTGCAVTKRAGWGQKLPPPQHITTRIGVPVGARRGWTREGGAEYAPQGSLRPRQGRRIIQLRAGGAVIAMEGGGWQVFWKVLFVVTLYSNILGH
jgi:hypothetical protein